MSWNKERVHWNKGKHYNVGKDHPRWGKHHSEETKKKISESNMGKHNMSEEHRQKLLRASIGRHPSEETRKKMSEARKRGPAPMLGKHHSEESKRKMSEAQKGKKCGEKNPFWGKRHSDEAIRKMFKATNTKPNKCEKKLNEVLQRLLPDEYKYVGGGQFILSGKCPDFININGKKKIIEFFGNYWHQNESGEERKGFFKEFGFETLIIWQNELKNMDMLSKKIIDFNRT